MVIDNDLETRAKQRAAEYNIPLSEAYDQLAMMERDGEDVHDTDDPSHDEAELDAARVQDQEEMEAEADMEFRAWQRQADRVDGYDLDDLGESPDY